MPLNLPPNFKNDIAGRDTSLIPIVIIEPTNILSDTIFISTNSIGIPHIWGGGDYSFKPLLLNIPSLKESIDIEKRNYKISSINLDISNFKYEGIRFSELVSDTSLINTIISVAWYSPSCTGFRTFNASPYTPENNEGSGSNADWATMWEGVCPTIFQGTIRKYDHDDEKVRLTVEDRSQATLHKDLPLPENYLTGDDVPDKYKNKPIPIVYGHVDRSPCVVSQSATGNNYNIHIDSKPIGGVIESDYEQISSISSMPSAEDWMKSLVYVFDNGIYYPITKQSRLPIEEGQIVSGDQIQEQCQVSTGNNIVELLSVTNTTDEFTGMLNNDNLESHIIRTINNITNYENEDSPSNNVDYSVEVIREGQSSQQNAWNIYGGTAIDLNPYIADMYNDPSRGFFLSEHDTGHGDWVGAPRDRSHTHFLTIQPQSTVHKAAKGLIFNFNNVGSFQCVTYLLRSWFFENRLQSGDDTGIDETNLTVKTFFGGLDSEAVGIDNVEGSSITSVNNMFGEYSLNGVSGLTPTTWDSARIEAWSALDTFSEFQLKLIQVAGGSGSDWNGAGKSFRSRIYGWINGLQIYHRVIIDKATTRDFYANVNGRALAGGFSPTAPVAIANILNTELGQVNVDGVSFTYTNWKYAFTVDKKINSKKLIEGIASASPYIPRFNNMGEFKFDVIPEDGGSVPEGNTISDADVIDFSFSRTSINDVYTKIEFFYNWDYARGEFNDSVVADIDLLLGGVSPYNPEYYGFEHPYTEIVNGVTTTIHPDSTFVIDDDRGKYIRDEGTAQSFADWYLMWSCNQKLKMKIKLPLKYMFLEIGDMVDFGETVNGVYTGKLLGGVKPYGIDYTKLLGEVNGQEVFKNFLITSTNKTLEWVEIEAIMMHSLDPLVTFDCAGIAGGTAIEDVCGICDGGVTDVADCEECPEGYTMGCDNDCAITGQQTGLDDCGVCNGEGEIYGYTGCCEDKVDLCGVCNGGNSTCAGCPDVTDESIYIANEIQHDQVASSELVGVAIQDLRNWEGLENLVFIQSGIGGTAIWYGADGWNGSLADSVIEADLLYNLRFYYATGGWDMTTEANIVTDLFHPAGFEFDCTKLIDPITDKNYLTAHACCGYDYCTPFLSSFNINGVGSTGFQLVNSTPMLDCNIPFIQAGQVTTGSNIINVYNLPNDIYRGYNARMRFYAPDGNDNRKVSKVLLKFISDNEDVEILIDERDSDITHYDDYTEAKDFYAGYVQGTLSGEDIFKINNPEDNSEYEINMVFTITTQDGNTQDEITYEEIMPLIFIYNVCADMGDVDGSGSVNVLDITRLVQCVLAENCETSLEFPCAGDMNHDGGFNQLDIVNLINYIGGHLDG